MTVTDRYFHWLCNQVAPARGSPGCNDYSKLFQILHKKRFYSIVEHDENRGTDGMVLRDEFAAETGLNQADILLTGDATLLEVLVYLARRMSFDMTDIVKDNSMSRWFWEMMDNLELTQYTDYKLESRTDYEYLVDDILERLLARQYSPAGVGGLFPLWKKDQDQRYMEIAAQCQQYLYDRYQGDIFK